MVVVRHGSGTWQRGGHGGEAGVHAGSQQKVRMQRVPLETPDAAAATEFVSWCLDARRRLEFIETHK